ncbi:MAG: YdcF family protein [Steroidobacteraceae bacterium]
MTVGILLLLVIAATVLTGVRRRQTAAVLFVITGVLALAIGCGPLPAITLKSLQTGYSDEPVRSWQPRAAIVVLGGGVQPVVDTKALEVPAIVYGRIVKTLDLYRQCKLTGQACSVIVSGGDPRRSGTSEAKVYGGVLVKIGVDPADLVIEGRSLNTWQNAQFCAAWLRDHPQDQVVLVTSGVHLRRSSLYFAHFGIHALPARADYVGAVVELLPQAYNFLLMDLALHEYSGLARYRVYEMLGWNIKAQRPGAL